MPISGPRCGLSSVGLCNSRFGDGAACHWSSDKPKAPPSPGPMLKGGILVLNTPDFNVNLVRADSCRAETESRRR